MRKINILILGLTLSLLWVSIASSILSFLGYSEIEVSEYTEEPFWYSAFFSCIWAPIWEELTYRWVPVQIAKREFPKLLLPLIVLSSALFGWGHGECQEGVFIQGVLGLIFTWVYLKTDNILYCILLHCIYNSFITFSPFLLASL